MGMKLRSRVIQFGWITKQEMLNAIEEGVLDQFDICFTRDTHEQYIINAKLEPVPIKSHVRVYGSVEAAISDIQNTSNTYVGEIISVSDGDKFIAYVVNQFDDGTYYIAPAVSDSQIDYDKIQNIPIVNLEGTTDEPVILSELNNGYYKISGHFITPDGVEVTSYVGNFIIVNSDILSGKQIKRISSKNIVDYSITDEQVTSSKYITEDYIKDNNITTTDYVDNAVTVLKNEMEKYIQNYVATTVTLLIHQIVNDEIDARYSTENDIESLFK